MSSKLFRFTEAELELLKEPSKRKFVLTADTWEEATRFMFTKPFGALRPKYNKYKIMIGYSVNWLERKEQSKVKDSAPDHIIAAFNEMKFPQELIELHIKQYREMFRR